MANAVEISSGVQELIDKLKNEGIAEGEKQANHIINEAQMEASQIIAKAKSEADQFFAEAHRAIEVERLSANEAIKMAFRDSELTLRSKFRETFSDYLKRLVSYELQDKDFIKQFVLAVASLKKDEVSKAPEIEILLPSQLFKTDENGIYLTEEGKTSCRHLILGITGQMLREGVELSITEDFKGGVKVRLVGEDIEIDLTDEAFSNLLLKYLLPRYRSIVSGQE